MSQLVHESREPRGKRKSLRALIVENEVNDADLTAIYLQEHGYDLTWERVETAVELERALLKPWDIILSDFSLPSFSAPQALEVVNRHGLDIPFLIISGTVAA